MGKRWSRTCPGKSSCAQTDSNKPAPAKPSRSSPLLSERKIKQFCVLSCTLLLINAISLGSSPFRIAKLSARPGKFPTRTSPRCYGLRLSAYIRTEELQPEVLEYAKGA